jgi:hypothetical protein
MTPINICLSLIRAQSDTELYFQNARQTDYLEGHLFEYKANNLGFLSNDKGFQNFKIESEIIP